MNKRWTQEQLDFIRLNSISYCDKQLTEKLNATFGTSYTLGAVRKWRQRLKLVKEGHRGYAKVIGEGVSYQIPKKEQEHRKYKLKTIKSTPQTKSFRYKDYTGQIINGFEFYEITDKLKHGNRLWKIKCHCGNIFESPSVGIINGVKKSCGCLVNRKNEQNPCFTDYTGQEINGMTFIRFVGRNPKNDTLWEIKCFCGKHFISKGYTIKSGHKKSCGCLSKKGRKLKDWSNKVINNFKILKLVKKKGKISYYEAVCHCDKTFISSLQSLRKRRSCGCIKPNRNDARPVKNKSGKKYGTFIVTEKYEKRKNGTFWLCCCECKQEKWISTDNLRHNKVPFCKCKNPPKQTKEQIQEYRKQWYLKNYYDENSEYKLRKKEHYQNNKEKILHYMKSYNKTPRGRAARRRHNNKLQRRIICNLMKRIKDALKCERKKRLELIGCSGEYLKQYLESKFLPGMSWDNYGFYGWHIDHIRPCCSFDLTDPAQQHECFHYSNLQPLWAKDNLKKGGKWGV